jgi:hypothetical protein
MRAIRLFGFIGCCVAAGLAFSVCPANANLIANGSFETPTVPNGSFTNFPVGSSALTGWNVFGPSGTNVSIVSGSFSQNGVTFPAENGSQWLDLTGDGSNSTEGISQSVATSVGDVYQLSYYIGNTTGGSIFGTTSTVIVSLNGASTFTDTNSTVSPTTQNWEQFTHDFTATSATTDIAFLNGDPSNDNNNGLENIVLLDLGSAPVPEPSTLAVFGSALAGLGLITLLRRKTPSSASTGA